MTYNKMLRAKNQKTKHIKLFDTEKKLLDFLRKPSNIDWREQK